jgi:hypothetical protein
LRCGVDSWWFAETHFIFGWAAFYDITDAHNIVFPNLNFSFPTLLSIFDAIPIYSSLKLRIRQNGTGQSAQLG